MGPSVETAKPERLFSLDIINNQNQDVRTGHLTSPITNQMLAELHY